MDDQGEGSAGVEIPEHADYILFAEDLVNYVMRQHSPNYVSERGPIQFRPFVNNPFDEIIQRSIQDLVSPGEICLQVFVPYTNNVSVTKSPESYRRLVTDLENDDFAYGFDARVIIAHSGNIAILASNFYNDGVLTAPELAKSHIFNILRNYMPAYGWHLVRRAAEIFPIDDEPLTTDSSDSH